MFIAHSAGRAGGSPSPAEHRLLLEGELGALQDEVSFSPGLGSESETFFAKKKYAMGIGHVQTGGLLLGREIHLLLALFSPFPCVGGVLLALPRLLVLTTRCF